MIEIHRSPVSCFPRAGLWLLVLLGTAAIAVGVHLLQLHGQGTCGMPHQQCPRNYDTRTLGLIVLGVTVVVGVVAAMGDRPTRLRRADLTALRKGLRERDTV